jgi:hypothetical protein
MRKGLMGLALIVSMIASQTAAFGWGHTGHMVVAQIAHTQLNPKAAARVDQLVKLLDFRNRTYDRITLATMMDDFRSDPTKDSFKPWHFTDKPFFDGIPPFDIDEPAINAEERINFIVAKLKSADKGTEEEEAQFVAYLFHIVGDIHQPLHATTRFSPETPKGDQGGNLFLIKHPKKKLHSYWDAAGGFFNFQDVQRPLNKAGRQSISTFAKKSMTEYPTSRSEWKNMDVSQWVTESHDLAESAAYKGIKRNAAPTATYQNKVQKVCRKRLAMAGYRLAALLNEIYPE